MHTNEFTKRSATSHACGCLQSSVHSSRMLAAQPQLATAGKRCQRRRRAACVTRASAPLNKYSQRITQPKSQGASQAMLYATGLKEEDMSKAQVREPGQGARAPARTALSARARALPVLWRWSEHSPPPPAASRALCRPPC